LLLTKLGGGAVIAGGEPAWMELGDWPLPKSVNMYKRYII